MSEKRFGIKSGYFCDDYGDPLSSIVNDNGEDRKLGISYTDGIPVRFRLDEHLLGVLSVNFKDGGE